MKQKSKKLIILFIISLVMILGFATIVNAADDEIFSVSCANGISKINLILGEHDSESLSVVVKDGNLNEVSNPHVEWRSSDSSIATVDSNGLVTAVKAGTINVTATVSDKTANFEITVTNGPIFTDFSNAKYEMKIENRIYVNLYINNIKSNKDNHYYYCITNNSETPNILTKSSGEYNSDDKQFKDELKATDNGELFSSNLADYVQLNQDLYLWVYEFINLENAYKDENGKEIRYSKKLVVSGQKLERPEYPVYAEMFFATMISKDADQLIFNLPIGEETTRKFNLKIGKISDKNILNGIKNNKGEAWNSLQEYAKNSEAIFNKTLSMNKAGRAEYVTYLDPKPSSIELNNLENDEYYFIYVVFDDENGKYYHASGLSLAKAYVSSDRYGLYFLGDDKFKWDDFGTIQTGTATIDKNTKSTKSSTPSKLPYTGTAAIGIVIIIMIGTAIFFKVKNNKYKGI